jgi:hypothetical protein
MRRPALLIAGMLLATGTGLALASPASAAVSNTGADSYRWHCHWNDYHNWNDDDDWWDGGNNWSAQSASNDSRRWCHYRHHRWHHGWSASVGA